MDVKQGWYCFFYVIMRRIYLSIDLAREVVTHKEQLEALAFAILIKQKFVSSVIEDATVRRCKSLFGMGTTKISRLIKNGLQYGFLERQGNDIIALKVRTKGMNNKLYFTSRKYKLSEIIDLIRKTVILNTIRKQNYTVDTIKKANNPTTLAEAKSKKLKEWRKRGLVPVSSGLSNSGVMQLTSTKRYRAKRLLKQLRNEKQVLMTIQYAETDCDVSRYSPGVAKFYRENKEEGRYGYVTLFENKICYRLANAYTYISDTIKYVS